jgi:uncharacterized membrane protein
LKLFEFESPVTGKKDSLLDLGGMWGKVFGVFVMFLVVAAGQNLAKKVTSVVPALDTTIDPIIANQPVKVSGTAKRLV